MAKNAVDRIVELVQAAAPELPPERLTAIALLIHRDMAGTRPYIPKAPVLGKASRLGEQLAAGVPLAQAFANAQISRATGFRILNRPYRVRG